MTNFKRAPKYDASRSIFLLVAFGGTMGNLAARAAIKADSKKRVKKLYFGNKITNICAGDKNPMRLGFFVRYKSHNHLAEITDGCGKFGDYDADVIYPGHIEPDECKKLFEPVWEARFGN